MSNHKDSLVKVLEYLVNDEREKAVDLLHNVFVEKAKNHWASITENDESVEEDIQDEDLDETYDVDEAVDGYDAEEDFLDDIESASDEIDHEEIYDDEDMGDEEAVDDLSFDMTGDDEDMGDDMDDAEAADPEEALANVEDAIAELRAAFADLMGGDSDESEEEPEMEGFGESIALKSVKANMADGSDNSAKSPVGKGGKGPTDAKPHPTDTKAEAGGKAPAAKAMSVKGPEAGAKLSAAPAPKREMK